MVLWTEDYYIHWVDLGHHKITELIHGQTYDPLDLANMTMRRWIEVIRKKRQVMVRRTIKTSQ